LVVLTDLLAIDELSRFQHIYASLVDEGLNAGNLRRDDRWAESVAVGSKEFIERFQSQSGRVAAHRKPVKDDSGYRLLETAAYYIDRFGGEMDTSSAENVVFSDESF
jgi:hypothetical protein